VCVYVCVCVCVGGGGGGIPLCGLYRRAAGRGMVFGLLLLNNFMLVCSKQGPNLPCPKEAMVERLL